MKTRGRKRIIVLGLAALVAFVGLVCAALFLNFVRVPTGSMMNTILPGDCLVANLLFSRIERGDVVIFRFPGDPSTRFVSRVIGLPGETIRYDAASRKILINGNELAETRIFVEPRFDNDDPSALKPIGSSEATARGQWSAYYYQAEPGDGSLDDSMAGFAVAEPYRIPVKGNDLPDQLKRDPKLSRVYDANQDGRYDDDQYFVFGDNRDNALDGRFWGTVPRGSITAKALMVYWSVARDGSGKSTIRWDRLFSKVR